MHWIDESWNLLSATLCCKKQDTGHTADEIDAMVKAVMEESNLNSCMLVGMVTDSASNMNSMGKFKIALLYFLFERMHYFHPNLIGMKYWDKTHIYCVDHILELTTKLVSDHPATKCFLDKIRSIVTHFKQSNSAMDKLLYEQENDNVMEPLRLLQDIITRWWSTYTMCERFRKLQKPLNKLLPLVQPNKRPKGCFTFTTHEWADLEDILLLLKPFMYLQRMMEGQQYVTNSMIPFAIFTIRQSIFFLNADPPGIPDNLSEQIKFLLISLQEDFVARWGDGNNVWNQNEQRVEGNRQIGIHQTALIAAALDPRLKGLEFIPKSDVPKIWQHITKLCIEIAKENTANLGVVPTTMENNNLQPLVVVDDDDDDDCFAYLLHASAKKRRINNVVTVTVAQTEVDVQSEVNSYNNVEPEMRMKDESTGAINNPLVERK